jgi:hypothetical protein
VLFCLLASLVNVVGKCNRRGFVSVREHTYHNADTRSISKRRKQVTKPSCVVDYNRNMRAIDLKDQLLNMYLQLVERKRMSK